MNHLLSDLISEGNKIEPIILYGIKTQVKLGNIDV